MDENWNKYRMPCISSWDCRDERTSVVPSWELPSTMESAQDAGPRYVMAATILPNNYGRIGRQFRKSSAK